MARVPAQVTAEGKGDQDGRQGGGVPLIIEGRSLRVEAIDPGW